MILPKPPPFSAELQRKINSLKQLIPSISIGTLQLSSPLILAPLASITTIPFRLLMQDLGAGATVSELISCHGINHNGEQTLKMLEIDPAEKNTGIQLFGEAPDPLAKACTRVLESNPAFIDLNIGCPVKKVVSKGAGAALLLDIQLIRPILKKLRKTIPITFSIKIRTGWDSEHIVADDLVRMAIDEGVDMISIHGRTRAMQYRGKADWSIIEKIATTSSVPIIGNGDLHSHQQVQERLKQTSCKALMLGRGPLRMPFIFLETFAKQQTESSSFSTHDYLEIIERLYFYLCHHHEREQLKTVQIRKHVVWLSAGYPGASAFRRRLFEAHDHAHIMRLTREYLDEIRDKHKKLNLNEEFLSGGHG